MATPPKRLEKSRMRRVMFGVTGGIADYLGIDVVLVRVAFAVLTVLNCVVGLIGYIALAVFMPDAPETPPAPAPTLGGTPATPGYTPATPSPPPAPTSQEESQRGRYVVGGLLVLLGVALLLQQFHILRFWWWQWRIAGPAALIVIGLALVIGRLRR